MARGKFVRAPSANSMHEARIYSSAALHIDALCRLTIDLTNRTLKSRSYSTVIIKIRARVTVRQVNPGSAKGTLLRVRYGHMRMPC